MSELLSIKNLNLWLAAENGPRHVLRGIDISLEEGGFYGLIGESGCGKTMTARSVLGMLDGDRSFVSGEINLCGTEMLSLGKKERRAENGLTVSYISQDPMTALNPLYPAGEQIAEVLRCKKGLSRKDARRKTEEMLESVGLTPGVEIYRRYPHQFSGGQLQRICIAMAVCTEPKLIIADEPTTALDVTTQAQILELLRQLRRKGICILLITHDFGVVAETCDYVFVMHEGMIVERGPMKDVFTSPKQQCTARLIESAVRKASYDAKLTAEADE